MNLPEFLTQAEYGSIRLTGHRIGLEHVLYYYNEGYSPEKLVEQYPTLSLGLVQQVIAFYLQHRAEVDDYLVKCRAEVERQRAAAPQVVDFEELRRRFEAMRRGETA